MAAIPPSQSLKATRSESDGYIEKRSKKYKKWSIGGLFKRKKKVSDTDSSSSSEDADRKKFLSRQRSVRKGQSTESKNYAERSKVNHPARHNADIVRFEQRELTQCPEYIPVGSYNESLSKRQHKLSKYRGRSLEDVGHKSVKGRMERSSKERLRVESSSDDAAESSIQSSNVKAGSRDASSSLRSRASRTERYKKRVLRHDESLRDTHDIPSSRSSRSLEVSSGIISNEKALPNNQWTADIVYYESSDYETKYTAKMKSASSSPVQSPKAIHKNLIRHTSSPTPSTNSVPTYAREVVAVSNNVLSYSYNGQSVNHSKQKASQRHVNTIPPRLPKSNSDTIFTQSPLPRPMHIKNKPNQSNITKMPPLKQIPPQPPPRDPQRKVLIYNGSDSITSSYNNFHECDNNIKQLYYPGNLEFGSSDSAFRRVHLLPQYKHMDTFSSNESRISNSDHSISNKTCSTFTPPLKYQRSTVYQECSGFNDCKLVTVNKQSEEILDKVPNQYHCFTDQPRSRKPIHIACKSNELPNECYLSDSQVSPVKDYSMNKSMTPLTKSEEVLNAKDCRILKGHTSLDKTYLSDDSSILKQSNSSEILNDGQSIGMNPITGVHWPDLASSYSELTDISRTPHSGQLTYCDMSIPVENAFCNDNSKRALSPQSLKSEISQTSKHTYPSPTNQTKIDLPSTFEYYDKDHKITNIDQNRKNLNSLEDALNELEAIYKSLKLDDDKYDDDQTQYNEDSLDGINRNEWDNSTGVQSDLSYNYNESTLESCNNTVYSNKRPTLRRSETPNPITDDMAYRRLIKKEKHPPQGKEVISQAGSFLLVSPTLSPPPFFELTSSSPDNKEPDITYDDVVYRNIQHSNNTFKILDPQPPFGIPLCPVTPTPNSSYLCVNSKETYRPTFKPKKYPDIVADDLAFRNLRKDKNKEQVPKVNTDQDQIKKSSVENCSISDRKKIKTINFRKDLTVPFNRSLAYNNNNLEEDLDELQSFAIVTDSNKVSGFVPKAQYAKPVILESVFNSKDGFNAEHSNITQRIATGFSSENPFSPKYLTEMNKSATNPDLIDNNSSLRSASLSIQDFDNKSVSFAHPTFNNLTTGHNTSKNDSPLTLISEENNKVSISVNPDLYEKRHELNDSGSASKKPNDSEEHDFDRVPTCKIVKLDTLCITEDDNNCENKQPTIAANTTDKDVEQALIDLSLELEDGSNFHFLEYNMDREREHSLNNENSASSNTHRTIPELYLTNISTDRNVSCANEFKQNDQPEIHDVSAMHCSGVKLLPIAKPMVFSFYEDSQVEEKSCQPLSRDSDDEGRVNLASSSPLTTAMSNEGTKEKCVLACNQHAFVVCMVWLHQLAIASSLDLLTMLSLILAIAAFILAFIF